MATFDLEAEDDLAVGGAGPLEPLPFNAPPPSTSSPVQHDLDLVEVWKDNADGQG